jgi:cytochrome c-type biogenesis protein CcmH/NrfG
MKSHMEALELAREAKRLMPDSAHALAIYGMAVYYLGDNGLKEALSVLQEALRMDPGCVEAATHLVTIYEAKGQHQEALDL